MCLHKRPFLHFLEAVSYITDVTVLIFWKVVEMYIFVIFYSAEFVFEIYMTVPVSHCAGRGV